MSDKAAFRRALLLFREAAQRVPAYKDFLKKHRVNPESVKTASDFSQVPTTDKPNYVTQYPIKDLSWDGTLDSAKYISTSSGSTGVPFFWPRGARQDIVVGTMVQHVFEKVFETKRGSTLFIDSFALGTWIAGLEFYNAVKLTAERGSRIVIVTPGIDKAEAINQIKMLSRLFDRVVLGGYPPFVKDILEHGTLAGIDWNAMDIRLLIAGEAVSETWKRRILEMMGKPEDAHAIVNVYGMADSGVVAHDSPVCASVRRFVAENPSAIDGLPDFAEVTGLYQYYPEARYFESVGHSLILTSDAGLPMIRYDTRDTGGLLEMKRVLGIGGAKLRTIARRMKVDLNDWQLPFVYLYGRKDLSISLYALNIYVDNLKSALEGSQSASFLSGLFIMSVEHTETLDQQFSVIVELADGVEPNRELTEKLTVELVEMLKKVNSEYAKLLSSIGERAKPHITLVKYGQIETIPGRKHKWIKRSAV